MLLFCNTVLLTAVFLGPATAAVLPLPASGDLVGEYAEVVAVHADTLVDLARRHGLGYEEVVNANPGVDPWLPGAGTLVRLPLRRVLPDAPREGIVVNLPEHRLYYFPPAKPGEPKVVVTYPISVGKMDWSTPIGLTRVAAKIKDPLWYPPESVRAEHASHGDILPKVVPAGPDNPLGLFAMRLAIPGGGYLIHGTNKPVSVGMQDTHGCMRLYPEDIEELFKRVAVDTPVRIVNQPHKVGWDEGQLFAEVHPPLEATDSGVFEPDRTALARLIANAVRNHGEAAPVAWARAESAFEEARGMPVAVTPPAAGVAATR
jgi:L,D-transpeptidase ErfK/SrfK